MKKGKAPTLEAVLKALSDPTRMRILALLGSTQVCVCHIHTALGIPQPTASRHLAHLKKAGLVDSCKIGLWVHYCLRRLPDARLQAIVDAARSAAEGTTAVSRDCCRLTEAMKLIPSPLQQQANTRRGENHPGSVHA
jgi:ArsR family transcriptional regulator, arsenate/arsenite/antimonite-responsive transcriptional repressor